MKKIIYKVVLALLALAATSCSSNKTLYSWYNYEDIVYQYSKNPNEKLQAKVLDQYNMVTEHQRGLRATVPPGLYAEYGFLLYKTGKKDEGLKMMKQEIALYPESEMYISRIIKQLEK